ncbi:fibronectin type III domain-containing protein [Actinokineospora guangxiensis]|uniref:Fibronectin type III domain-containing protein n=1 Tax=Actinokineospora guangxiensis TaxID=1490288 RepID=A0ABW0EN92_9PSEU
MEHRRHPQRLTTGIAAAGAAVLVAAGLVIGSGTGSAAQGELVQTYSCPLPLIGDQTVTVDIRTEQPDTIAAGTFTPPLAITAVSNAGATATQGLRLVGAETIQGVARATSTVRGPGGQGDMTVQVTTQVPNQPIPAIGGDLILNAAGSAPGLRFDQPGTASLTVTDLVLEMTPLRADGTPTDLGTFTADCTPAEGQDTTLQTYEVTGAAVAPEEPGGVGDTPPLRQVYSCPFPLIGNQNVTVDIDADLPGEIAAGAFTPAIDITAVSNAGATATQGLRLVGAETVEGSATATSLVKAPQGHLAVAVNTVVPRQAIPPVGGDLVVDAAGSAPALRFDEPGTATLSVHDLVLTMTPKRADGTDTGLGTFTADCTPAAGQSTVLHTFTITGAPDTEAPTAPGAPTAGDITQNSIALSWPASTDNVGVTGYDVLSGGEVVTSVEGTSAVVDGLSAGTEYSFTVVARDAAGNTSAASAPVTARTAAVPDTQAPTAPGAPTAANTTQTSVQLSWAASSDNVGVTGYDVLSGGDVVASGAGTSATVDGLSADTEYTFAVVAKDAAGNTSPASPEVTVRTLASPDTEAPSAPVNLRSTGAAQDSVGLAWDAASDNVGVTGYVVSYGSETVEVAGTSTTVTGLSADTEYSFTVVARDAAGNTSAASAPVTARTAAAPDTQAPSAPSSLEVTGATQSSITLSWLPSTDDVGVTAYEVRSGGSAVASTSATTATVDGLSPDTAYRYTVVAKDAAGNTSPASAEVTGRTAAAPDTQAPSAPGGLRATDTTETSVALAWNAASDNVGVTEYEVFRGSTSLGTVPGTTRLVTGLSADTAYTFTVVARDAAGNTSAPSAALSVRTDQAPDTAKPTAPGAPRSTGASPTGITLAWDAASDNVGVTGYEVRDGATVVATATGTSATVANLTPDTEYTFTVVAKDAAGNTSDASAPVTARTQKRDSTIIEYGYDLKGKSTIKAANGTVSLAGGIDADLDLATGGFTADLALNPTSGRFRVFGFIPASAKIQFVAVERTTGSLAGGVLTSTSTVTIKLPQVSILGFPIAQSPQCQTKDPATIPLRSKPNFDPLAGGTLTGTYTIPALRGCGVLTSLISALTTGPGNTIEASLTPRPR